MLFDILNLKLLAEGILLTLYLVSLSTLFGFLGSLPLVFARCSHYRLLRQTAYIFIFFFRGTPLLLQLFIIYFGLAQFHWLQSTWVWDGMLSEPFFCAVLAFSLNAASYMAEILFGVICQIPKSDIEAAISLGMSKRQVFWRIVFPQSWRISLPSYSNEVILLLKSSALASTITLMDLTGTAKLIVEQSYQVFELYAVVGLVYLMLNTMVVRVFRYTEAHCIPWRINPQTTAQGNRQEPEPIGLIDFHPSEPTSETTMYPFPKRL
jgi:putative lysine/arginine/ornithine/histidine/octopine transport system permease protein